LERNLKKFGLLFSKYVFIRSKQFSNGSASVYIYGKRQYVESLDPRITRLPDMGKSGEIQPKAPMDQFGTFEVFVQPKEGKPFEHEGIVHAPNLEMAFVLAKEGFTRRFLCVSLYVVDTRNVYVSPLTEGDTSAYDQIYDVTEQGGDKIEYEIFHLPKRGKQHINVGKVVATTPEEAMAKAKKTFAQDDKLVFNVWAIPAPSIRYTQPEETQLWLTLNEKKFRDASSYKGGDKLKEFLEKKSP
jgi:ring-1,2-phenylacetyl-CoA epoxidase subunit PaaB